MAPLRLLGSGLGWRLAAAARSIYLSRPPQQSHRLTPSDDELYQKTTIHRLEKESQDIMFIEGYSERGFTISGNKVVGPCAVLPQAILQWNVGTHKDVTFESLVLFRLVEPRIEILVLGTGSKVEQLDPTLLKLMRQCGIAVEVQDTPLHLESTVVGLGIRFRPNVFSPDGKEILATPANNPNACATFNFLTSERRMTAAGLIPPPRVKHS